MARRYPADSCSRNSGRSPAQIEGGEVKTSGCDSSSRRRLACPGRRVAVTARPASSDNCRARTPRPRAAGPTWRIADGSEPLIDLTGVQVAQILDGHREIRRHSARRTRSAGCRRAEAAPRSIGWRSASRGGRRAAAAPGQSHRRRIRHTDARPPRRTADRLSWRPTHSACCIGASGNGSCGASAERGSRVSGAATSATSDISSSQAPIVGAAAS